MASSQKRKKEHLCKPFFPYFYPTTLFFETKLFIFKDQSITSNLNVFLKGLPLFFINIILF